MASVVIYPPTFPRSAFEIISSSRNANHASAEILQQVLTPVERIENKLFWWDLIAEFWLSLSYHNIMIHKWTLCLFSQAILNSNLYYRWMSVWILLSFVPGLRFVLLPKVLRTCDFVMAGIFWPLDQVSWSFCARTTFTSMYSVSHLRFYILDFYSCSNLVFWYFWTRTISSFPSSRMWTKDWQCCIYFVSLSILQLSAVPDLHENSWELGVYWRSSSSLAIPLQRQTCKRRRM